MLKAKIEKYKPKSPEQKLELRSLDSYPYNQKLTDFFDDKRVKRWKRWVKVNMSLHKMMSKIFLTKIKDSFDIVFDEDQ